MLLRRIAAAAVGVGLAVHHGGCLHASSDNALAYLKTYRDLFNYYSSEVKDETRYMSVEDFVKAILKKRKAEPIPSDALQNLEELFREVDSNSDGKLSFEEFSMFMTLLSNNREDIHLCFKMFDFDDSHTVDFPEFKLLIRALVNDPTVQFDFQSGLAEKFFGAGKDRSLTFNEFFRFISDLKMQATRAEFHTFDPKNTGWIGFDAAARLLVAHVPFIPDYVNTNLRMIREENAQKPRRLSFKSWVALNEMFLAADKLERALNIYKCNGAGVRKRDFVRAVQAVSPHTVLGRTELDLIFKLYGNEEGILNDDDAILMMKSKQVWGLASTDRTQPRRNFVQAFVRCMQVG